MSDRRLRHRGGYKPFLGDMKAYRAAVLADSPLVLWMMRDFDDPTNDATGNGYDGSTDSTNAYFAHHGPLDQQASVKFDGSISHVLRADAAAFDGTSVAVSAWVRCQAVGAVLSRQDTNAAFSNNSFQALLAADDTVAFRRFSGSDSTTYSLASGITVDDNVWHWYAWKYTSTAFTAACDGVDLGSSASTGTLNSTAQDLIAGAISDLGNVASVLTGYLAGVAYWVNPTVTVADMISHYEAAFG